jgi:hypothetical protein
MSEEQTSVLNSNHDVFSGLRNAALDSQLAKGLTHDFYRYPARFSPVFIRQAITAFTRVGDLVIDPFVGGGTTAVEARVLGRRCVGVDINSLAIFVSQAKTTPLSPKEISELRDWKSSLYDSMNLRNPSPFEEDWKSYFKNIDSQETWPIKKSISLALSTIDKFSIKQQNFARCSILKTAQWALDSRKQIPEASYFKEKLISNIDRMLTSISEYSSLVCKADKTWSAKNLQRTMLLNRSVIGIDDDTRVRKFGSPRLILTSPPYPGVHILYHRWQVQGRRETPAPYWIANKLDGDGASYYTFGDRKAGNLTGYFHSIYESFRSLSKIANKDTVVVQMVAFNDPEWQFKMYLEMMNEAGFEEAYPTDTSPESLRIWRQVPNRKWFATQRGVTNSSKEVVLVHKLKS